MPIPILMPALSPTMEAGTLARWLVKEGDSVAAGDVIAEIETDKATMEVEAIDDGTVGKILISEGTENVAVNAPIAILLAEGEDGTALDSLTKESGAVPSGFKASETAAPSSWAAGSAMPDNSAASHADGAEAANSTGAEAVQNDHASGRTTRIFASPLARRLAKEYHIDLMQIEGSGPNGRIIREDVEKSVRAGWSEEEKPFEEVIYDDITALDADGEIASAPGAGMSPTTPPPGPGGRAETADLRAREPSAPETGEFVQRLGAGETELVSSEPGDLGAGEPQRAMVPTQPPRAVSPQPSHMSDEQILALYDPGSYDILPIDNMRKTIARRLVEAKTTIPHFYLSMDCDIEALLRARKRMNETAPAAAPNSYKLSVNDFAIKALAMALQQVPDANATWTEQGILRHKRSDIGVAVAVEGGLFTPVIRHAELKSLSEISNEMKDLAERARQRRLAPHEYQGGTTSISNLGMYGVTKFEAVINPPHATILALGRGEKRPVVQDGAVQAVTMMSVTLSCDHRVVDGALGAELLAAFKQFIEDPVTMLV